MDGNTGRAIHHTVGRCNRENSCGYHYTPKQYFGDHPELSETKGRKRGCKTNEYCQDSNQSGSQSNQQINESNQNSIFEILSEKIDFIPRRYVINSASYNSNFVRFLCDHFPTEKIEEAMEDYALGATRKQCVIFWQIDVNGNVRTGKVMQYNHLTGRRVKSGSGSINWVHSILKRRDPIMKKFNLCQCYFGEHLLLMYPHKPVAIVEAEKTAVIGSMIYEDFIWLAAGNLNGLTPPKSKVLQDRYVVLYPDAGCYEKWTSKMNKICNDVRCEMSVSDLIEEHATAGQLDNGYDIADYIIDNVEENLDKEEEVCHLKHLSTV